MADETPPAPVPPCSSRAIVARVRAPSAVPKDLTTCRIHSPTARRPWPCATGRPAGVVIRHSDRDSRYTSDNIPATTSPNPGGEETSPGRSAPPATVYDEAIAESFFATSVCEPPGRSAFRTHAEARMAASDLAGGFHNRRGRHSSLGRLTPGVLRKQGRGVLCCRVAAQKGRA